MMPTRLFRTTGFQLENGTVLPELELAYVTHGRLAPDGRNAVLLTHGYTSSHHMVDVEGGAAEGYWGGLVGAGKPIDTDRLFVVSSNMLGSSYGSTGPASRNPSTGRPYGPDFPDISLVDIVVAQRAMLDHLGVRHLIAVAGPSYGGFQAFQWAVSYPDFVDGIVPAISSPRSPGDATSLDSLVAYLSRDANWNGGRYYDRGGVLPTLTQLRIDTLKLYGIDEQLRPSFPDAASREAEIRRRAEAWAREFDANSLIVLRRANIRFDVEDEFRKIRARVLYVLSRTDRIFPPSLAARVMPRLAAAGVVSEYVEIDTGLGHSSGGADAARWAPQLRRFMAGLGD
ncbi:MAG: alpha/beta fold hydrolase [Alphaproteobacteria bacterium]|nr:alpha/beta fold hydrolase [Alphaproteobacteria bacterium]